MKLNKCRIAAFASGEGTNFSNLVENLDSESYNIEILISNNSKSGVLKRAQNHGVPSKHISSLSHEDPDNEILQVLDEYKIDLIVLCGYMKKISKTLIDKYPNRILNLHPSLLPKFGGKGMYGKYVHEAVLISDETVSGATVHLVNDEYDKGRIIKQGLVELSLDENLESLTNKVRKIEFEIFPIAIQEYWESLS